MEHHFRPGPRSCGPLEQDPKDRSSSQCEATAVQALLSLAGWGGRCGGGAVQLPASPVNICQVDFSISGTCLLGQHLGSQSWEPILKGGDESSLRNIMLARKALMLLWVGIGVKLEQRKTSLICQCFPDM